MTHGSHWDVRCMSSPLKSGLPSVPCCPGWQKWPCSFHLGLLEPCASTYESSCSEEHAPVALEKQCEEMPSRGPETPIRRERDAQAAPNCSNSLGHPSRVPGYHKSSLPNCRFLSKINDFHCLKRLSFGVVCSLATHKQGTPAWQY